MRTKQGQEMAIHSRDERDNGFVEVIAPQVEHRLAAVATLPVDDDRDPAASTH